MDRICSVNINGKKSPLCNDRTLYYSWKKIFEERWVSRSIALGIMFAESHIGANYAWTCNASWNNWWWVKARVLKNWKVKRDQPIPNWWGCRLYRFDSMEDYLQSKANMIWVNYKWCFNRNTIKDKVRCVSFNYVWKPNVAEKSWINNVMIIAY